jgi:hypothetical protein
LTPIQVPDLAHDEQSALDDLLKQLSDRQPANRLRTAYYESKNAVRDLGISTPPNFRRIDTVLGWPAKAVDTLDDHCNLDGFVVPGGRAEDFGIPALWSANNLDSEAQQAGVSSLIHGTAFLITTLGDVQSGEPPVIITAKDALSGAGIWDPRRRVLRSFLSVIDSGQMGEPTEMVMYLPSGNVEMTRSEQGGRWRVVRRAHSLGRVPVEPLMAYTDMALRTLTRSEVSAEFYSAPQRYLLGADESAFVGADGAPRTQWQAILGRIWAIDRDEDGELPQVGQFTQMSQQPHMDQLRSLASMFAGETSIPMSDLGISADANPISAEAYEAGRQPLIKRAEATTDGWSPAWERTVLTAIRLRDGLDATPEPLAGLRAKWRDAATPSRAAAADAIVKIVGALPWMADSTVVLEQLGFDQTTIDRLMADKRRSEGSAALRSIVQAAQSGQSPLAVNGGTSVAG